MKRPLLIAALAALALLTLAGISNAAGSASSAAAGMRISSHKGAASVASGPSLMKALLGLDDMPPSYGFRLSLRPQSVTAETQTDRFDVPNLRLYGWIDGAYVGFRRKVSHRDPALDVVTINMMQFSIPEAAQTAYEMILNRESGSRFNVGRIGSESAGRKIVVGRRNVLWRYKYVLWRYKNVVVALSGTYSTKQNNVRQLLALARLQQAKIVQSMH